MLYLSCGISTSKGEHCAYKSSVSVLPELKPGLKPINNKGLELANFLVALYMTFAFKGRRIFLIILEKRNPLRKSMLRTVTKKETCLIFEKVAR